MSNSTTTDEARRRPLLLSYKKAAEVLGLSEWQVRGLVDDGVLAGDQIRNRRYVTNSSVLEYVAGIESRAGQVSA